MTSSFDFEPLQIEEEVFVIKKLNTVCILNRIQTYTIQISLHYEQLLNSIYGKLRGKTNPRKIFLTFKYFRVGFFSCRCLTLNVSLVFLFTLDSISCIYLHFLFYKICIILTLVRQVSLSKYLTEFLCKQQDDHN